MGRHLEIARCPVAIGAHADSNAQVLLDSQGSEYVAPFRDHRHAASGDLLGRGPIIRLSPSLISPWRGVTAPAITFSRVDLPAPFGPETKSVWPSSIEANVAQSGKRRIDHHAIDRKQRHKRRLPCAGLGLRAHIGMPYRSLLRIGGGRFRSPARNRARRSDRTVRAQGRYCVRSAERRSRVRRRCAG